MVVVLAEVARKAYLASIVPVIVNTILNEHQIVADIVAFVNKGDFPRSRLGEKQRGKVLASWVTRKMRTMAQFAIRDAEPALSDVTETVEPENGVLHARSGSAIGSSLRNSESGGQILSNTDFEKKQAQFTTTTPPPGLVEMPATNYDTYSMQATTLADETSPTKSDDTPTDATYRHFELPSSPTLGNFSSEVDQSLTMFPPSNPPPPPPTAYTQLNPYDPPDLHPPPVGPKPPLPPKHPAFHQIRSSSPPPAVDGREGAIWTLPSQRGVVQPITSTTNRNNTKENDDDNNDEEWPQEAIMHMNLAGHSRNRSGGF